MPTIGLCLLARRAGSSLGASNTSSIQGGTVPYRILHCKALTQTLAIALVVLASRQVQAQGLNSQPMFVLPFRSSANVPGSYVFYLQNLGADGRAIEGSGTGVKSIGVGGWSVKGVGVYGENETSDNDGVRGSGLRGVRGITRTGGGAGVMGIFRPAGDSSEVSYNPGHIGTYPGVTRGWLATMSSGVRGQSDASGGLGVSGKASADEKSVGIYGESEKGFAGFFRGRVTITDSLYVRSIKAILLVAEKGIIGGAGAKFFKIDHPLDPANKFLYHASIESHEYKNLYDGVVTLDNTGAASVTLPEWFEALNTDFRYQLTTIGGYAPVYIAKEVQGGRFLIAGGRPGMRISWQVTGVRHDAYAKQHPVKVEETKAPNERGKYLTPAEHGYPESLAIRPAATRTVGSFEGGDEARDKPPRSPVRGSARPRQ